MQSFQEEEEEERGLMVSLNGSFSIVRILFSIAMAIVLSTKIFNNRKSRDIFPSERTLQIENFFDEVFTMYASSSRSASVGASTKMQLRAQDKLRVSSPMAGNLNRKKLRAKKLRQQKKKSKIWN